MVDTIKFSEFADGGDLANDETTVGLGGGTNTRYNNPWTFLKPGTTGDRPAPVASIYYRLRFNTTLEIYEYYDPTIPLWVELSGSGTGTVNPGVANDIAFYAASGQSVSPIAGAANAVLVSNGSKVPSMSTTLPSGLSIPGATITGSTAALLSGSIVAAPVSGTDITNKTYVDGLVSGAVTSITGTTNQVIASSPTGAVTLSLPQDIALGSTPTFAGLTLTSIPLGPSSGGTGVNNGSRTLTLAGNLATVGAFNSVFTMTAATNVTFPISGTLATTSQIPTGAALTKTDDTNVTLTLGGSPATALVNAASLTLGWAGLLSIARGGTGVGSVTTAPTATAFAGWDANSNLSANSLIPGFATTATAAGNTVLTVASKQIQEFTGTLTQTVTMPVASTLVAGQQYVIINNSSANVTVNSSGGNAIQVMAANTTLYLDLVLASGTTAASWNSGYVFDNGAGVLSITGTANQVIASASTGAVTLSLPQSIATTSTPTFANVIESSTAVTRTNSSSYTLTSTSTMQQVYSGTGITADKVVMPNTTTLSINQHYFLINKGDTTLAVTASDGSTITTIPASYSVEIFVQDNVSSTNASWQKIFYSAQAVASTSSPTYAGMTLTNPYIAGAGGFHSRQIFTSGTAATYTKPANVSTILIEVWGGGGGGGGALGGAGALGIGGAGGAGGYASLLVTSPSATYTYTVGAAGAAGTAGNNAGGTGGTTTFNASSLQATGGNGGAGSASITGVGSILGAIGGVGTNGNINSSGAPGSGAVVVSGASSVGLGTVGGSSRYGAGGYTIAVTTGAAGGTAAGGSGGISQTVSNAGGAGGAGLIIVWEFA